MKNVLIILLFALPVLVSLAVAGCGGNHDDADFSDNDDTTDDDDDNEDDDTTDDDDDNEDDDTDDDESPGEDFVATLEVNPICEISCVVTWTTETPATSQVQFGEQGQGYSLRIGSDDLTTQHEVVVVGMHTGVSYDLIAVSETQSKLRLESQELSFTAGNLPYVWMAGQTDVYDPEKVQEGWTLTNLGVITTQSPLVALMFDMSGEPVWYYAPDKVNARFDLEVSMTSDRAVLIGPALDGGSHPFEMDLKGNVLWEGPAQPDVGPDGDMHHVFHMIENGDFVTVFTELHDEDKWDHIVQFDRSLNTVWNWNFWDQLPSSGVTHVNSVAMDLDNQAAYVNSRDLSMVFKIDTSTDNVVWVLGEGGDFVPDSGASNFWFSSAHGIDYLGDNRILLYDNGDVYRGFSRAVIYHLNETNMEATIEWEYSGDGQSDQWYNGAMGDADMLDNGNVLICAGNGTQYLSPTRFIEVTPEGEKVWQMWTYNQPDEQTSSFQANRIPSLATPIP